MVERLQVTRETARVRIPTPVSRTQQTQQQQQSRLSATDISRINKQQNNIRINEQRVKRYEALIEVENAKLRQENNDYANKTGRYANLARAEAAYKADPYNDKNRKVLRSLTKSYRRINKNMRRKISDDRRKAINRRQDAQRRLQDAIGDLARAKQGRTSKKQETKVKEFAKVTKIVRRKATEGGTYQVKINKGANIPTRVVGGGSDIDKATILFNAQKKSVRNSLRAGVSPKKIQRELDTFYAKKLREAKAGEQEQYRRIARAFAVDFKKAQAKAGIPKSDFEAFPLVSKYITTPIQRAKAGIKVTSEPLKARTSKAADALFLKAARADKDKRVVSGAKAAFWALLGSLVQQTADLKQLPSAIKEITKNPSILKEVPKAINDGIKFRVQIVKTNPAQAVGIIAGDIIFLKGTGEALKILGAVGTRVRLSIDPKFIGVAKTGKTLLIPVGKKIAKLQVVKSIPKLTLAKQVALAGKRVPAISSQADALFKVLRGSKVVRKPVATATGKPLTKVTQKLLDKFDEGKLTKKQVQVLDARLKKEGVKGIQERSFFADPAARIRPSRLGIQKGRASLVDLFTGNVKFRSATPQILFFPNAQIQKFPSTAIFRSIAKKIKTGKPLTQLEQRKYLAFQLKRSGKFKPVGFLSREAEITLAPNEILIKQKVVGKTIVDGKQVNIIQTKVGKYTKDEFILVKKFRNGKISKQELKLLNRKLAKRTGFDYSITASSKKLVSLRRLSLSSSSTLAKYKVSRITRVSSKVSLKARKSKISRTSKGKTSISRPKTSIRKSRLSISRAGISKPRTSLSKSRARTSTSRGKSRVRITPTSKPPKKPPRLPKETKGKKFKGGYSVYVKTRGTKLRRSRWVLGNKKPLNIKNAKKLGKAITDNTISATYVIRKAAGKPLKKLKKVPKVSAFKFRKPLRKSRLPKRSRVEKRKNRLDTRGEKRGITVARYLAERRRRKAKKKVVRRKKR